VLIVVTERFHNSVIGSDVAGKILSWTLAKQNRKTAVVERSMIGDSCPNVLCLPSKNVIYSAKAVSLVDPGRGLGVVKGSARVDLAGVARRKRQMVEGRSNCTSTASPVAEPTCGPRAEAAYSRGDGINPPT